MIKKETLEKLKMQLISNKKELLERFKTSVEVDEHGDETDKISAKILLTVASNLNLRNINNIKSIDNALVKIESATYGICEECEEYIAEKRLLINPCFTICISCAEAKELQIKKGNLI